MTAPASSDPQRVRVDQVPEPVDFFTPTPEPLQAGPLPTPPSVLSRLIYLSLAVLPGLLVLLVLLARAGVITGNARGGKTPWDLGILVATSVIVLAVSAWIARRLPDLAARSRSVAAIDASLARWEVRVLAGALAPALALTALGYFAWAGVITHVGPARLGPLAPPLMGALAVLLTCGPVGYFSFVRERNIQQLEDRFPDFLRDLNESYGAGLTMAQAIRVASRGDYGKLNPELRRMANQVSWGTPFPEALRMFGERVGTPIITRAVALIIKATRAGGNAKDVLAAASRDAREIKALQNERKLSMTLYVIVIYVAFGVFLGVVAALQGLLVPALLHSTQATPSTSIAGFTSNAGLSITDYRYIYFGVGLVQAIGSGIVAGVMAEGGYAAGLKHATIMLAISVLVLGLLL